MAKMDKAKRNTYIIGGFIVVIMVGSILGMWEPEGDTYREYNGFKFYSNGQSWFTRINNQQVPFYYLPQALENITVDGNIEKDVSKIYLATDASDMNYDYSLQRIKGVLYYFTAARFVDACVEEDKCINDIYPLVDCKESQSPILYMVKANQTQGYMVDNCLVIEAEDSESLNMISEKLVYKMLGVIDG